MASDEKKNGLSLSKVFKKAAWIGLGFLVGGFLDFTLFHDIFEFQELIEVSKPMMNSFWYMTGLPKLAEWLTVALGGQSRQEALQDKKVTEEELGGAKKIEHTPETSTGELDTEDLENELNDMDLDMDLSDMLMP